MNNSTEVDLLSLPAPHYAAGVYLDTPDRGATLADLCARLQSIQHAIPLAARVAVGATFPEYAGLMYGISAPVETTRITDFMSPLAPDRHLLEASLASKSVGRVLVSFETIAPELVGIVNHPLCVTINAELLDAADNVSLDPGEQQQASVEAKFLFDTLRDLAEHYDPLFGAIVAEEPIPTPPDLASGQLRSGNVFISNRLLAADEELEALLSAAYVAGYAEQWRSGWYYSNWAPLNPASRTTESPFRKDNQVTRALGRALHELLSR